MQYRAIVVASDQHWLVQKYSLKSIFSFPYFFLLILGQSIMYFIKIGHQWELVVQAMALLNYFTILFFLIYTSFLWHTSSLYVHMSVFA